jgi:hypothetical protein
VLRLAYAAAGVVLAGVILAALISLIVRFHRARGIERQQLKWFAYGTALLLFLPAAGITGVSLPAPGYRLGDPGHHRPGGIAISAVRHRPAHQPGR